MAGEDQLGKLCYAGSSVAQGLPQLDVGQRALRAVADLEHST